MNNFKNIIIIINFFTTLHTGTGMFASLYYKLYK